MIRRTCAAIAPALAAFAIAAASLDPIAASAAAPSFAIASNVTLSTCGEDVLHFEVSRFAGSPAPAGPLAVLVVYGGSKYSTSLPNVPAGGRLTIGVTVPSDAALPGSAYVGSPSGASPLSDTVAFTPVHALGLCSAGGLHAQAPVADAPPNSTPPDESTYYTVGPTVTFNVCAAKPWVKVTLSRNTSADDSDMHLFIDSYDLGRMSHQDPGAIPATIQVLLDPQMVPAAGSANTVSMRDVATHRYASNVVEWAGPKPGFCD